MKTSITLFSLTKALVISLMMMLLLVPPTVVQGARYSECNCFAYALGQVCPGSTYQFEQKGWHGYCESRGNDASGACKCYNCDSCKLVNQADYRRKRSVLQPEFSYFELSSQAHL